MAATTKKVALLAYTIDPIIHMRDTLCLDNFSQRMPSLRQRPHRQQQQQQQHRHHHQQQQQVSVLLALLVLATSSIVSSLDNGLARTPPMGWLAWERFTCTIDCASYPNECINHRLFEQMADRLSEGGYKEVGYEYVNIDDCWSEMDREQGRLVANRSLFPDGMRQLAEYVHKKGLKLGIYGDCGSRTCARYPAQLSENSSHGPNNFEIDALTFNEWAIDSFKFDGCFIDPLEAEGICPEMSVALKKAGRPILLNCEWPFYMQYSHVEPNYTLASKACNLWRYYDDILDGWLSVTNTIDYTVKHQSTIVKYHGPGHWFDPDQLLIGDFGLSLDQWRTQMAIWAVWAAPLYMSNDLRDISPEAASIIKNVNLIRVNQDRMGVFGLMTHQEGDVMAFVKPVEPVKNKCPSFAVVYFDRRTIGGKQKTSIKLSKLLANAPIYQAAKHQREYLKDVPESQLIDASDCLARIGHLVPGGPIEFRVQDLFLDRQLDSVSSGGSLELLVAPNSVRAVLIEEK